MFLWLYWQFLIPIVGLSHEQNLHKMRLLTFMQMAEGKQEIDYETIEREMKLESEELEAFIIDGA